METDERGEPRPVAPAAAERECQTRFMLRAVELSRIHMHEGAGGPFGAVVVLDGAIVGEGWNQVTSLHDPTAHAEIVAIRHACAALATFRLAGAVLYTSCEPCPMCLAAAYWARVSGICYATTRADAARHLFDDEFIYREIPKALHERSIPTTQLLRDAAYEVFKEWEAKQDKVRY